MSLSIKRKMAQWQIVQQANNCEMERLAILNGPLPKNDPQLFTPTRVKVLRSFCIAGKPTQPDEIVSLPWHLAQDMVTLGKVSIIQDVWGQSDKLQGLPRASLLYIHLQHRYQWDVSLIGKPDSRKLPGCNCHTKIQGDLSEASAKSCQLSPWRRSNTGLRLFR